MSKLGGNQLIKLMIKALEEDQEEEEKGLAELREELKQKRASEQKASESSESEKTKAS